MMLLEQPRLYVDRDGHGCSDRCSHDKPDIKLPHGVALWEAAKADGQRTVQIVVSNRARMLGRRVECE